MRGGESVLGFDDLFSAGSTPHRHCRFHVTDKRSSISLTAARCGGCRMAACAAAANCLASAA